jgi:hypothetical protein
VKGCGGIGGLSSLVDGEFLLLAQDGVGLSISSEVVWMLRR